MGGSPLPVLDHPFPRHGVFEPFLLVLGSQVVLEVAAPVTRTLFVTCSEMAS